MPRSKSVENQPSAPTSVGAFEAKTHLSALLERVAGGETIEITRHGVAVALIVPSRSSKLPGRAEAIAQLKVFRKGRKASRALVRRWREEGRT